MEVDVWVLGVQGVHCGDSNTDSNYCGDYFLLPRFTFSVGVGFTHWYHESDKAQPVAWKYCSIALSTWPLRPANWIDRKS